MIDKATRNPAVAASGPALWSYARWTTRVVVLVLCLCLLSSGGTWQQWSVLVPAVSPLATLATLLAARTVFMFAWLGLAATLLMALRHRWFCHWVCPLGTCIEGGTRLGRRCGRRRPRLPAVGSLLAAVTLGGACLGYPLLLWLDPLALFSGSWSVAIIGSHLVPVWACLGLVFPVLLSLVWPHSWCGRLCPLGGLQDMSAQVVRQVRSFGLALIRPTGHAPSKSAGRAIPRRVWLAGLVGLAWAAGLARSRSASHQPLRPPGSADEQRFTSLCLRCGNCIRACPTEVILADGFGRGVGGLLAPLVEFREDYCLETCNACTLTCPSGAITPVPLAVKMQAVMGIPRVDMTVCLLGDDRECSVCRNRCPFQAISLEFSEIEYTLTPRVNLDRCPGCGACQVACPTQPRKAIVIEPAATLPGNGNDRA